MDVRGVLVREREETGNKKEATRMIDMQTCVDDG